MHRPYCEDADWWPFACLLSEMLADATPFAQEDVSDVGALLHSIVERPIEPAVAALQLSEPAAALLAALLVRDPAQRLGARPYGHRAVLAHAYFDGLTPDDLLSPNELATHAQGAGILQDDDSDIDVEQLVLLAQRLPTLLDAFGPPAQLVVQPHDEEEAGDDGTDDGEAEDVPVGSS
jgi:serine/threonine protein kinase